MNLSVVAAVCGYILIDLTSRTTGKPESRKVKGLTACYLSRLPRYLSKQVLMHLPCCGTLENCLLHIHYLHVVIIFRLITIGCHDALLLCICQR